MTSWNSYLKTLPNDLLASIVVFLVALPLCMGIAIASGVPPDKAAAAGLMTGIVGGIVVGLLGGSQLQVSGPAAGLTVIVYEMIQEYGWEKVGVLFFAAGAIQLAAGLIRVGPWFRAVSPAVIYGMLSGIGVLIFASQFHIMLDDSPKGSGLMNLISFPEAIYKGIVPTGEVQHETAARIGILTILVIIGWNLLPKRIRLIPAALIAVVIATVVATVLNLPINKVQVPENFFDAIQLPVLPTWEDLAHWQKMAISAVSLAFIASAETLLCATAVDKMHQGPRTNYDRELAAQGVGNMICGLIGALPMTGVIVRSAANVDAGAKTRLSAVLHGVWLLLFVAFLPQVLSYIPTAALAALLVYTGYKLINLKIIPTLAEYGWSEVAIYIATVVFIVATDLLTGVVIGIILAVIKLAWTFSTLEIAVTRDSVSQRTIMHLRGAATFMQLPKLAAALEQVPPNSHLHVHFEELSYIDHACLDLLINWEKQHEATGGTLDIDWEGLEARFRRPAFANGNRNTQPKKPSEAAASPVSSAAEIPAGAAPGVSEAAPRR
ncbi:MAG: SulP family inorganic anion transporter [Gemmatales bacterium]|nr:SulP family inorganic anion transporter [Gemmatales bacterium]MDW8385864.1 SulP family inorganic anion transporter [Gemmatales bacterium]